LKNKLLKIDFLNGLLFSVISTTFAIYQHIKWRDKQKIKVSKNPSELCPIILFQVNQISEIHLHVDQKRDTNF
jgi:hypothetical protein